MGIKNQEWIFCTDHGQICQVFDIQLLCSQRIYRVWLPRQDAIVRVRSDYLKPLDNMYAKIGSHQINYITTAARADDALTHNVLLDAIESSVIPLPHQIRALSRAISNDSVRYLLADEIGLGKTIEAGLILRELKLRGLPLVLFRMDTERKNG